MKNTYSIIKKTILSGLAVLSIVSAKAQDFKTAYFMDKSPLRITMNPAMMPERGYINIPGIGSINGGYTSNSLSFDKLFFPRDGKLVLFTDPSVDTETFLNGLKPNNRLNVNLSVSVLGFGFYSRKAFWNVNIGVRSTTQSNIPKSLFAFAKEGNGPEGKTYQIRDLKLYTSNYVDLSIGYARELSRKVSIGGAVKVLIGAGHGESYFDYMDIEAYQDKWKITSSGVMNIHFKGLSPKLKYDERNDKTYINGFNFGKAGISGAGAALDFGVTYRPTKGVLLAAAVNDLGFIRWSESSSIQSAASGTFIYQGFKLPVGNDPSVPPIKDQQNELKENLMNLLHFEPTAPKGRTTMLAASFNLAAEYSVLQDKIGFGVLYTGAITPARYEQEITLSANFRPVYWFSAALSYSFLYSDFNTFGFALNFSPSWINFYLGSDYMVTRFSKQFIPIAQTAANFYFGMSVPLSKKKGYAHYYRNMQ